MGRQSSTGYAFLVGRPDGRNYSYHRVVPAALVGHMQGAAIVSFSNSEIPFAGRKVIRQSLGTCDLAIARERWAELHQWVEQALRDAKAHLTASTSLKRIERLSPEVKRTLGGQTHHDVLADDDRAWVDDSPRNPMKAIIAGVMDNDGKPIADGPVTPKAKRAALNIEERIVAHKLASGDIEAGHNLRVWRVPKGAFDTIVSNGGDVISQLEAMPGASVEHGEPSEIERRLGENGLVAGNDNVKRAAVLPILRAHLRALNDIGERRSGVPIETPQRPEPVSLVKPAAALKTGLLDLHDLWVKQKAPDDKAISDSLLYIRRFTSLCGEVSVEDITFRHVESFRDQLRLAPRNAPKSIDGDDLGKLIAYGRQHPDVPRLSAHTINTKAIGTLSRLMEMALVRGMISFNPCRSLSFDKKIAKCEKRLPFTATQLGALFSSSIWTDPSYRPRGCGGEAAFWLPLISLYGGLRLEEIGQLRAGDVQTSSDGISFIAVTIDEAQGKNDFLPQKRLKTDNAIRNVPIHSELIARGFLDYVSQIRTKHPRGLLFAGLGSYRGRTTKNWSRWFGRYLDDTVSNESALTFHSLRHNFIDALRAAHVPKDEIKALVGHASSDTTDDYGIGHSLIALQRQINKIKYGIEKKS